MLTNPHVESTTNYWPNSQTLKDYLSLPLTLSLHPFAHEQPVSSIDEEQIGQYRCQSCKAFINKLCFVRNQHEYDCSICGCTNYLQKPIDIKACQLDQLSYKIKAPSRQRLLTSKDRLAVFVLDLTFNGQQSKQYLLYSICIIKEFLKSLKDNKISMNVALIGFDTAIHRFSLKSPNGPQRFLTYGHLQQGDDIYFPQAEEQMGNSLTAFDNFNIILSQLQDEIKNNALRKGHGEGLLDALKIALRLSQGHSGKIFLVSGLKHQVPEFKINMSRYMYDSVQKHSFVINKKQCIKGQLEKQLQSSQMSLNFFIVNAEYINLTPFHVMAKHSNGILRHYFPNQNLLFFHDFRRSVEHLLDQETAYESLLKVRYSTGVKLVGMFGNFRPTKIADQIQLITCSSNMQYLFEFHIEGRVSSELVVVQFSSLYTSLTGERFFIIETHGLKVTESPQLIIDNIDYINVNISYVRGVTHNLDSSGSIRSMQLAIQQRCRKHISVLRELSKQGQQQSKESVRVLAPQLSKRVRPYVIITFLMMKHFLLSQNYENSIHYDLNFDMRSKIATLENSINIIWPITYTVTQQGWEMAELQEHYIPKASVAIFIDRCDQYYCYLADQKLQAHLRTANAKDLLKEMIENNEALAQVKLLIEEIMKNKSIAYLDILPLQDLKEFRVLDMGGQYGFDKFINILMTE